LFGVTFDNKKRTISNWAQQEVWPFSSLNDNLP
jgi:hypothetical protein